MNTVAPTTESIGKLTIKIHWTETDVQELKSFWSRQPHQPNSDINHFLLVCRLMPKVLNPCVFSLWQEGVCQFILVGRIEKSTLQPTLGYFKLPSVHGRILTIIRGGAIGSIGKQGAELLIEQTARLVQDHIVDIVVFNGISEQSTFFISIRNFKYFISPRWEKHWELALQPQPGFLLQSMKSKNRGKIKRLVRNFETAYDGRISWKWYSDIDNVIPLCRKMESVAAKTYQRALNVAFKDDELHRERHALFSREGWLRIIFLEVDHDPVAFWSGLVHQNVFHSLYTCYDPALQNFGVGTQMFIRLVDALVMEGVSRFDFGVGDAHYKQRFGDTSWNETTLQLFGNSWRSRMMKVYLVSWELLDSALRNVVQRFGLLDRLKKTWRTIRYQQMKSL